MKKLMLPVFAILFCLLGCSDDGGTKPETPKPSPYSGVYYIFSRVVSGDCAYPPTFPLSGQVIITGSDISFFGFDGTWDDAEKRGYGTTDQRTLIINATTGCIGYYYVTFDITFSILDSTFAGTVGVDFTYSAPCSASACHTDLEVNGKRQ